MVSWSEVKKQEHLVMVTPRKKLFGEGDKDVFQGFLSIKEAQTKGIDYVTRALTHSGFLTRGMPKGDDNDGIFAELDENYQQIIPYVFIVNSEMKKVYAYQRGASQDTNHENRLHGNWSWGVGGHIDFQESYYKDGPEQFLVEGLKREIEEEVTLNNGKVLGYKVFGMINDDSNAVGRVHFGLAYICTTDSTDITPGDEESVQGRFLSIGELEELTTSSGVKMDNWSRLAIPALKEFLS